MRRYFRVVWHCWFASRLSFIAWLFFLLPSLKWLMDGDKRSALIYAVCAFFAVPAMVLFSAMSEARANKKIDTKHEKKIDG